MNKLYLAILFFSIATADAQISTKQQNIRKLIDISTKGQMGDSLAVIMLNGFQKRYPQADSAFWQSVKPEINLDKLFDQLIPVYDKYYTEEDVKELLAFYERPIGKKMIALLPQIMNQSMTIGQQWGIELEKKVQEKLKSAGY